MSFFTPTGGEINRHRYRHIPSLHVREHRRAFPRTPTQYAITTFSRPSHQHEYVHLPAIPDTRYAISAFSRLSHEVEFVNWPDPGPVSRFLSLPVELADMIWTEAIREHLLHAADQSVQYIRNRMDLPQRIHCPLRRVCRAANAAYLRTSYDQTPIYYIPTKDSLRYYRQWYHPEVLDHLYASCPVALFVHADWWSWNPINLWDTWIGQIFRDVETVYISNRSRLRDVGVELVLDTNNQTYWLPPGNSLPTALVQRLPTINQPTLDFWTEFGLPSHPFRVFRDAGSAPARFRRLRTKKGHKWAEVIRININSDGTITRQGLWPRSWGLQMRVPDPDPMQPLLESWRSLWPNLRNLSICAWEGPPLPRPSGAITARFEVKAYRPDDTVESVLASMSGHASDDDDVANSDGPGESVDAGELDHND